MSGAPSQPSTVSVLLPVRNEAATIDLCLERILANDYPHDRLEILVVDGDSDDDTVARVRQHAATANVPILIHRNPQRLPYTALNIALEHATGEIILRVDARSIIPLDYIRVCVETLQETGAANVGGVQRQYGETPIQEAIALATGHPFGVGNAAFRLGGKSGPVDTVYLGCFRRSLFEELGRFDEDGPVVSEDSGLNKRIRDAGHTIYLNAELIVRYPAKDSYRALARQYFIYGGAKAHIFLKYRHLTAARQFIPLLFLVVLAVSLVGGIFWPPLWLLFALTAGSYLLVAVLSSLQLCWRERRPGLLPYLLLTFPCIHFPWPIGFLVRLCEGKNPGTHWRG